MSVNTLNKRRKEALRTLATSMTALLFLVIGGSGLLLFFHLFEASVKELHEVLGLFFVAAVLLHLFFNWGGMRRYFPKKLFIATLLAVTTASSFFVFSAEEGENPKVVIIESVLAAPLDEVSRLLGVEPQEARERLAKAQVDVTDGTSLKVLADTNKRSPFELIGVIRQQDK